MPNRVSLSGGGGRDGGGEGVGDAMIDRKKWRTAEKMPILKMFRGEIERERAGDRIERAPSALLNAWRSLKYRSESVIKRLRCDTTQGSLLASTQEELRVLRLALARHDRQKVDSDGENTRHVMTLHHGFEPRSVSSVSTIWKIDIAFAT